MKKYLLIALTALLFASCSKEQKPPDTTAPSNNTPHPTTTKSTEPAGNKLNENTEKKLNEGVQSIKAKFVSFTLGDASHYTFVDEAGKEWDFGDNESDKSFAVELSEEETNSTNQGWGSNNKLEGKWFNIKYEIRKQPQYEGGPVADVPVILEAVLAE